MSTLLYEVIRCLVFEIFHFDNAVSSIECQFTITSKISTPTPPLSFPYQGVLKLDAANQSQ
jgi:hypothetical protein